MKTGKKIKAVEVGEFCTVQVSDFALEYGIKKKDVVYIAGDGIVAVTEDDPYQMRRVLVCAKVDKGGHVKPDTGAFTIDGLKLKPCNKPKQVKLQAIFEEDFKQEAPEEQEDEAAN